MIRHAFCKYYFVVTGGMSWGRDEIRWGGRDVKALKSRQGSENGNEWVEYRL